MSEHEQYEITEAAEGMRLDKALLAFRPDTGLRYRRRLCEDGLVRVDGKTRKPGYKVRAGQSMTVALGGEEVSERSLGVRVVRETAGLAAVYKPGGVHSAHVAGKDSPSVEALLPSLFNKTTPVLLNRLDYLTSGLLLVALDEAAVEAYQGLEDAGGIQKFYLAEVQGRMDGIVTIRARLDTANRKTSKVLAEDDSDERRWTEIEALAHDHGVDTTLVRCLIMKGARHQIRAHLASVGHPIVGDPLYGDGGGAVMRLHHQRVVMPGFEAKVDAPW